MEKCKVQNEPEHQENKSDEDPKKIAALIAAKGDDYYRLDKFPDQALVGRAEEDFQGFRTGTPDMNVLAADMRRFYGMNAQPPATTHRFPHAVPRRTRLARRFFPPRPGPRPGARVRRVGDRWRSGLLESRSLRL